MSYIIQIRIRSHDPVNPRMVWRDLHPTGQFGPYVFKTYLEAERMMKMCYPDHPDSVRIVDSDTHEEVNRAGP